MPPADFELLEDSALPVNFAGLADSVAPASSAAIGGLGSIDAVARCSVALYSVAL